MNFSVLPIIILKKLSDDYNQFQINFPNTSHTILSLPTFFVGIYIGINYHSLAFIFWQLTIPIFISGDKNEILDNF